MVHKFFIGLSRLAATGETEPLKQLDRELAELKSDDEEMDQLRLAIDLNLRYFEGEDVRDETAAPPKTMSVELFSRLSCSGNTRVVRYNFLNEFFLYKYF